MNKLKSRKIFALVAISIVLIFNDHYLIGCAVLIYGVGLVGITNEQPKK